MRPGAYHHARVATSAGARSGRSAGAADLGGHQPQLRLDRAAQGQVRRERAPSDQLMPASGVTDTMCAAGKLRVLPTLLYEPSTDSLAAAAPSVISLVIVVVPRIRLRIECVGIVFTFTVTVAGAP